MKPTILILSGPTHEHIDPIRFLSNASSGKMGCALAEEAARRGYTVHFITGPVPEANLPSSPEIQIHKITSANEMLLKAQSLFSSVDAALFAAAVADYAPAECASEKLAKTNDALTLQLRPTPDIAKTLCAEKQPNQKAIGFALQTHDGEAHARRKLEEKNLDGIVLNSPATLGASDGTFSYLARHAEHFDTWGTIDKTTCAQRILQALDLLLQ